MFIDPMISEFLTHVSCMLLWISEFLNAWDFPVLQYIMPKKVLYFSSLNRIKISL